MSKKLRKKADIRRSNLRKPAPVIQKDYTPTNWEVSYNRALVTADALAHEVERLRIAGDRLATEAAKRHPEQVQDWWAARNGQ